MLRITDEYRRLGLATVLDTNTTRIEGCSPRKRMGQVGDHSMQAMGDDSAHRAGGMASKSAWV